MGTLKHEKTESMIKNIKEAQEKKGYTAEQVANQIGIPLTTYKNIIRSKGGNDYVKDSIISKLADLYDCSTDYILGLSDDETCDRNNRKVIRPLDFSEQYKLIYELSNYLNSDFKTLRALHYLLCQTPSWRREEYLKSLQTFTNTLMETSFWENFKERTKADYEFLVENSIKYGDEYSNHISLLDCADFLLKNANYKRSLKTYLKIIYNTLSEPLILEPIANKAISQVLWLNNNWDEFPTELKIVVDTLPQIQQYHFIIKELSNKELLDKDNETYTDIKLSEQIKSILQQYLFSTEGNE